MVAMMMGDQDVGQRPALALQRLDDGRGLRRVDRGGRLGRGVVDQIAEIIGEAGEQANFRSHDISANRQAGNANTPCKGRNMALTLLRQCNFPRAARNAATC